MTKRWRGEKIWDQMLMMAKPFVMYYGTTSSMYYGENEASHDPSLVGNHWKTTGENKDSFVGKLWRWCCSSTKNVRLWQMAQSGFKPMLWDFHLGYCLCMTLYTRRLKKKKTILGRKTKNERVPVAHKLAWDNRSQGGFWHGAIKRTKKSWNNSVPTDIHPRLLFLRSRKVAP